MIYKEKFISPQRTLELIEIQANAPENISFAKKYFPAFKNGEEIWEALKPITQFKADPLNVDTIQGISTLFSNTKNIHRLSGLGDCDCFTSALASIAIANKLPYQYIIQGNNKPSHIAIKVAGTVLDLTNPIPDYLREYSFTKYINPMFVALADDGEMAQELDDFGRPNLRRFVNVAKQFAPPVITRAVDSNLNRVNRILGISQNTISPEMGMAQILPRAARKRAAVVNTGKKLLRRGSASRSSSIIANLPPAARAKLMLQKRKLKRFGYGDSEAELLALQNFSDDFGGRKVSFKRGLQNVGKFAMKAAPILLPVAGGALNFIAPGVGGKIAGIAAKGLQRVGGMKTLTTGRNLLKQFRPSGGAMQSTQPEILSSVPAGGEQIMAPMQIMSEPVFPPSTYVTPAVPVTAPKINPMLLIGGAAVLALLLTRKK